MSEYEANLPKRQYPVGPITDYEAGLIAKRNRHIHEEFHPNEPSFYDQIMSRNQSTSKKNADNTDPSVE